MMKQTLPDLPYAYDALEPHYDEQTVRLHHDVHHKAYVDGLNNALAKLEEAREKGDFTLIKHWERELAFHGGGHILHTLFWENMKPNGGGIPSGKITEWIHKDFKDYETFKKQFSATASAVEGSGWTVLCWNPQFGGLDILQIEKHQNQALLGVVPLLILDLWEHAYYLKYQNKRATFIEAWWNLVNWDIVNKRLGKAL